MPASVTLSSTTLAQGVSSGDSRVKLTSVSGVVPGLRLYVGGFGAPGELMRVDRLDVSPWVVVTRGVDGSKAGPHSTGETVYIGRADQFYSVPPFGRPEGAVPVSPYIDIVAGKVYYAQGDTQPSATAVRWWQEMTTVRVPGVLGAPSSSVTLDPTSST
jgi:hypothetical protein